jgi:hypothetical protein
MEISKDDYNELLSELIDECSVPDIKPNEVNAKMLADNMNIGYRQVSNILARKESAGELTSHWVRYNGRRVKAYRKAK